jgi:hypothetical protein
MLERWEEMRAAVRKTYFLRHLYIKTIILPRQARDKHRESTQKRVTFFAGRTCERVLVDGCYQAASLRGVRGAGGGGGRDADQGVGLHEHHAVVKKRSSLAIYIYKYDFTKTGSGQT